ncbi:MAG: pyridoxamine 5'-phosphate oxidase family protein, partial [Bacteroidetes bacterium]|nr:pyridoxamine 5'-phosphate oxidase family protein [Bacteroidota bacterium]
HKYIDLFAANIGSRQIIVMELDMVQTSCGYAVPFMDFKEERTQLRSWSDKQGTEKLLEYQRDKNRRSIDDFETGIFED